MGTEANICEGGRKYRFNTDRLRTRSTSPPIQFRSVIASSNAHLQRSASDTLPNSSLSCQSTNASQVVALPPNRRRGFTRPQATVFADSAKCRESVMSLGTITHIQHFFARTGLLDGKGGQYLKGKVTGSLTEADTLQTSDLNMHSRGTEMKSLIDHGNSIRARWECQNSVLLPPTVSTYHYRQPITVPPPAPKVLRQTLRDNLMISRKLLTEINTPKIASDKETDARTKADELLGTKSSTSGWLEIQGLRLLDVFTLTISAAKNYYTAHDNPQRLYSFKSEKELRSELYQVLEILRSMAVRDFKGGVRPYEAERLLDWLAAVEQVLRMEESSEEADRKERENWPWRSGNWTDRVREREWLFLSSFDLENTPLPIWPETSANGQYPNDFLKVLQNGLRLVLLHNRLVKLSRRPFELIKIYHVDVSKTYRSADNLRYWIKAAQLRWDIKLEVNVMGVVRGSSTAAWQQLDNAVLKWSQRVREDIVLGWAEDERLL